MLRKNAGFTLKLSREKIQLFLNADFGQFKEIGSADPNQSDIGENLKELRNQVYALTGDLPLIDVMLPDELILVQNLTIKNSDNPISIAEATEQISKACKLEKDEINVAVGFPTSDRTQPVAAITTKTLRETRQFLETAGFKTNNFMASRSFVGFSQFPNFAKRPSSNPNLLKVNKVTIPIVLSLAFFILISAVLLIPKPSEKFEFSDINSPSINTRLPTKNLASFPQEENKQFILGNNNVPSIEGKKVLSLPKTISGSVLPQIYYSKTKRKNPYFIEKIGSNLSSEAHLSSLTSSRLNFSKQSQVPELEKNFQPELANALTHNEERLNMLRQYAKFQTLKSFIQDDYLESIQPNLSQENRTVSIKKGVMRGPTMKLRENEVNKSRTSVEPKLSLVEKIRLKLSNKINPIQKDLQIGITVEKDIELDSFLTSIKKLETPKIDFDQGEQIKSLIDMNLRNNSAYQLTPEQILLSNKYRPIVRPAQIGKINVLAEPTISSGAITLSQNPIARPKSVESLSPVSPNTVKIVAKATKRPSFPQRASIVNNATITNIIELNRTNLIGIFGTKQNAIALVRLASGRIIKVKVGDRFEGWKVLNIYNDKIELANGNKQEMLRLPG